MAPSILSMDRGDHTSKASMFRLLALNLQTQKDYCEGFPRITEKNNQFLNNLCLWRSQLRWYCLIHLWPKNSVLARVGKTGRRSCQFRWSKQYSHSLGHQPSALPNPASHPCNRNNSPQQGETTVGRFARSQLPRGQAPQDRGVLLSMNVCLMMYHESGYHDVPCFMYYM